MLRGQFYYLDLLYFHSFKSCINLKAVLRDNPINSLVWFDHLMGYCFLDSFFLAVGNSPFSICYEVSLKPPGF